jgi:hypothetical protein
VIFMVGAMVSMMLMLAFGLMPARESQ